MPIGLKISGNGIKKNNNNILKNPQIKCFKNIHTKLSKLTIRSLEYNDNNRLIRTGPLFFDFNKRWERRLDKNTIVTMNSGGDFVIKREFTIVLPPLSF